MYQIALIVGRFQPFHKGHLYLVKKALEAADKIVFGIGSASIYDENNPLSYEERKKILEKVIKEEKIKDRVLKIVPLEDFFNDKKWLKNLEKQVGEFDLALGNNNWTNKILRKAGYKVMKVDYFKRTLCEGWRIRKLIKEGKKWQDRVPNYLIKKITDYELRINVFQSVVLGGTFDHFHKGHKALLTKAFEIGKKITIGVATEKLYKNKFLSETVESFDVRQKNITNYINYHLNNDRAKMVKTIPFSEFTGGADKIKEIDAIVVSKTTYSNALKINQLRKKNKLHLLKIITINDVLAEDGKLISSERIRAGEISRTGKIYKLPTTNYQLLTTNYELIMPESLREELRKPFKTVGAIFKSPKKPTIIIAIGDIIVNSLLKSGIDPDVKIIDFRSRRKRTDLFTRTDLFEHSDVLQKGPSLNKPGTINLKTAEIIKEKIKLALHKKEKSWITVDGEEDLLALPAILFAPLGSLVLYGHWQYGIITVVVDEKIKGKVRKILLKFK